MRFAPVRIDDLCSSLFRTIGSFRYLFLTGLLFTNAFVPARTVAGQVASTSAQSTAGQSTTMTATSQQPVAKRWYDTVSLTGYVQFDSTFPEGDSRYGSVSNFRIRRARPSIIAQIDPQTMIKLQLDMSTGKACSGAQNAVVGDSYIGRTFPGFGFLKAGQTYFPFSRELREDHAARRSPLEMSYVMDMIALGEVDLGVVIGADKWDTAMWQWEFALFNGQGLRTADANPNKTVAGRIAYRVNPYIRVGASGVGGSYKDISTTGTGKTYRRDALGAELQLQSSKALSLSAEMYNCLAPNSTAAPTAQARFTGGYVLLESWIGPMKSIPFVRWQRTYGDLQYRSWDFGWRYQMTPTQRLTVEADIARAARSNCYGARWQVNF
jgi:hypothetical protein